MRYVMVLLAAIYGIFPSLPSAADDSDLSCADLAARRAARQYDEENAAREERQSGLTRDSALQRDLSRLNAESYGQQVYENCMRLKSMPEPEQAPAPPGD